MKKIAMTGTPPILTVVERSSGAHAEMGASARKRSIVRNGHKSSVSLEDPFWSALREIAMREKVNVSALVATFDHGRKSEKLSSAIRVFVLDYFMRRKQKSSIGSPSAIGP